MLDKPLKTNRAQPLDRLPVGVILQAGERGLRGQGVGFANDGLKGRIIAQRVGVVLVLVACGNLIDSLAEHFMSVVLDENRVAPVVATLRAAGARVSLFIEPDPSQIAAAERLGAPVVELHTGRYAELWLDGGEAAAAPELERLKRAAADARRRGIEPHAGHGLTFENVGPVAAIPELAELNIGHFLVGEAIFIGLEAAIREMRRQMDLARGAAAAA